MFSKGVPKEYSGWVFWQECPLRVSSTNTARVSSNKCSHRVSYRRKYSAPQCPASVSQKSGFIVCFTGVSPVVREFEAASALSLWCAFAVLSSFNSQVRINLCSRAADTSKAKNELEQLEHVLCLLCLATLWWEILDEDLSCDLKPICLQRAQRTIKPTKRMWKNDSCGAIWCHHRLKNSTSSAVPHKQN